MIGPPIDGVEKNQPIYVLVMERKLPPTEPILRKTIGTNNSPFGLTMLCLQFARFVEIWRWESNFWTNLIMKNFDRNKPAEYYYDKH